MTNYTYENKTDEINFAKAPDDATYIVKILGKNMHCWGKLNPEDNALMIKPFVDVGVSNWSYVAETVAVTITATRFPVAEPLHWKDAPEDAEYILRHLAFDTPAWGKNASDSAIEVMDEHESRWHCRPAHQWSVVSVRNQEPPAVKVQETPSKPALRWEDAPEDATLMVKGKESGEFWWAKHNNLINSIDILVDGGWRKSDPVKYDVYSHRVSVKGSRKVALIGDIDTQYSPAPFEPTILQAQSGGWGFKPGQQFKGYVVAYHADWLWFAVDGVPEPTATRLDKVTFTKPLTPEEEARAKAVNDLEDIIKAHLKAAPVTAFKLFEEDLANTIINAGYRKGENTL